MIDDEKPFTSGVVKIDQKINFQSQKKLGHKQETADWTWKLQNKPLISVTA